MQSCWLSHHGIKLLLLMTLIHGGLAVVSPALATSTYGVLIDMGSTGSRVRIYRIEERSSLYSVPKITDIDNKKEKPGVAEFGQNTTGLHKYIKSLVDFAKSHVPEQNTACTPIYAMATAGMRLIAEDAANNVIEVIDGILNDKEVNPFLYSSLNTRILSGEEEGVFAWITVNYALGLFQEGTSMKSRGVMELGGASMQIAFQPSGSILAEKFPVRIAGRNYPLYVHSYLPYGKEFGAEKHVFDTLQLQNPGSSTIDNPCMLRGDTLTKDYNGTPVIFQGAGDFAECKDLFTNFISKAQPKNCFPKSCAIGTVYQPSIDDDDQFWAITVFLYTLKETGALTKDGDVVTVNDIVEKGQQFCAKDFEAVKNTSSSPPEYLSSYCLISAYIPLVLNKGFGFANDSQQIRVAGKINDLDLEYPVGALIYEIERGDNTCGSDTSMACTTHPLLSLLAIGIASILLFQI